jgi:hypothetical protein
MRQGLFLFLGTETENMEQFPERLPTGALLVQAFALHQDLTGKNMPGYATVVLRLAHEIEYLRGLVGAR